MVGNCYCLFQFSVSMLKAYGEPSFPVEACKVVYHFLDKHGISLLELLSVKLSGFLRQVTMYLKTLFDICRLYRQMVILIIPAAFSSTNTVVLKVKLERHLEIKV